MKNSLWIGLILFTLSAGGALAVTCDCTVNGGDENQDYYLDGGCRSKTGFGSGYSCESVARSMLVRQKGGGTLTSFLRGRPIGGTQCKTVAGPQNYITCVARP